LMLIRPFNTVIDTRELAWWFNKIIAKKHLPALYRHLTNSNVQWECTTHRWG
jgi:hypothetical protein